MTTVLDRFPGHLNDFGPVPPQPFRQLHDRVLAPAHGWPEAGGPEFSKKIDGLDNVALWFPVDYPASHLNAVPTAHWPNWQDCVSPLIDFVGQCLSLGAYTPAKVLLSKLRARHSIAEHVDLNPASQTPHKVHIPIVTTPEVVFTVEGIPYHLAAGRAYELNNLRRHAVYNRGTADRVHLIIELYPTR